MTKVLDEALAKLRELPQARQEEVAAELLTMVEQGGDRLSLSPEQIAEVERRLSEAPSYADHAAVRAFFQMQDG
ncbi:MAG: hypothetical protein QGF53_00235 [Alphaproteobacteria bacterium]|jgi:hypothetical protein|nr:hypothetical protein [Alphaproteobacteria bacterium]